MRRRKTDYGTVILHWLLVAATAAAFISGLRIASETPDRTWINLLDAILPCTSVWTLHIKSAVALTGIALAYAIYLARSGLTRRVQLDKMRLRGLVGRRRARLAAVSALLTWGFFAAMLILIASGGLLYFGLFAGFTVTTAHWLASWAIPAFIGLHVLVHAWIGGTSQLFRIIRPGPLPPPPPRLDAVELLTMLVEQNAQAGTEAKVPLQPTAPDGHGKHEPRRRQASGASRERRRRNVTLQTNPLLVAAAAAMTATWILLATNWLVVDTLRIHRIASADAPVLDGDTSDPVWRNVEPLSLMTNQGGNFDGKGESRVQIRAVHDGTWAYFLFTWEDPTRSLKQLPLIKRVDGWHLLHDGYERGDERAFNEDKFAVLFTTLDATLAGDRTFHASPRPIPDAPATMSGRGLHYTMVEGLYADVWQWKATSGGPTGWMDDDHFGPPLEPTATQVSNRAPYRGGFDHDPGTANYSDNFVPPSDPKGGNGFVRPLRLPKDMVATGNAMGLINLDPDVGESDGARWFMTEAETVPYTPELDRAIPVGTVVPGVIVSGEYSGDRADIRCAARWASGHWALEVARRLDTHSQYDVPLKSGVFMRVAAFDHSEIRHTRHVRPIRIEVE
ncbi:ethylbenzene dehydrogenase-related protein [Bradyrhizobium sp. Tv2a-2]|uniref:ethylbenzene dehydrogenase-related protein n=1 Tax=Bradyrhizobium sp. Tv2a-2 TaxID=113395 RepID=UPI0003F5A8C1|nr:ethylbenzene dehydrogenase-related protein [Bradyrhizobium sp. Tv2a-2]